MRPLARRAIVLWALAALVACGSDPERISDADFVTRANLICADVLRQLESNPTVGPGASFAERADSVELVAGQLEDMVGRLRASPVDGADRAAVEEWVAAWDELVGAGRRYAVALRSGDSDVFEPAGEEADRPTEAINRFAKDNGLEECIF